ncbi:docking domain of Afi1 for Arf3 in vesicle trafficking-domain-containing protein [Lipomyces kononenkoae]|uniref:Docking domain of Afi1 for Arf3 in vesicle trafficking-domain-containing protein n=1 Tax=Lipomyces kononenkoae TaxID=34357 RepID=A0ACC3T4I8_LIPKO
MSRLACLRGAAVLLTESDGSGSGQGNGLQNRPWTNINSSPERIENMYLSVPSSGVGVHVKYILAAEFDVAKGPTVKYQYPRRIEGDEELLAELMLPDQVHKREEDWTVFFLQQQPKSSNGHDVTEEHDSMLYVLNLANTKIISDANRGAIVRAMAICTIHPFIQIYKPILLLAMTEYFDSLNMDVLRNLYQSLNDMDISNMPSFGPYETQILSSNTMRSLFVERFQLDRLLPDRTAGVVVSQSTISHDGTKASLNKYDTHFYESKIKFNNLEIPMRIPVDSFPDCVGDSSPILLLTTILNAPVKPYSVLHPHLTTSGAKTHPLIVLVNSLLTEKRVVFMGARRAAKDVVDVVLSACSLISSGILRGFSSRAYPYTDLSKIDRLIQVPGYIAGVTNPAFENHPSWWDVLCNIETGEVRISRSIKQPERSVSNNMSAAVGGTGSLPDVSLVEDITAMIANRYGEESIRCRFHEFISEFIQLCAAYDETRGVDSPLIGSRGLWPAQEQGYVISGHGYVWVDEQQKKRDLDHYKHVIEGWKRTTNYKTYISDVQNLLVPMPVASMDLQHQIDRLRKLSLSSIPAGEIFEAIRDVVVNPHQITQLLAFLPQYQGGLLPLAAGLFHTRNQVRNSAAEIIIRIRDHEAGRHFYNELDLFHKLACERLYRRVADADSIDQPSLVNVMTFPT